jgi:RNA polymerase sigma factor (sigma-70 family)
MRVLDKGSWAPRQTDLSAPRGCLTTPHLPGSAAHKPQSNPSTALFPLGAPDLLTAEQERVMVEHLPIVRFIARRIHDRLPPHVPIEDLYSAGVLGLLDAFGKFESSKKVLFRTYAQFRIRGAILDSLRTLDWSPRELRRKGRAVEQTIQILIGKLSRSPTDIEIAQKLNIPLAAYQQFLGELKGLEICSLHAVRTKEDSGEEVSLRIEPTRRRPAFPLPGWGDAGAFDQGNQHAARARALCHDPLLLRRGHHERDRTCHRCRGIPSIANPRFCRAAPPRPARQPQRRSMHSNDDATNSTSTVGGLCVTRGTDYAASTLSAVTMGLESGSSTIGRDVSSLSNCLKTLRIREYVGLRSTLSHLGQIRGLPCPSQATRNAREQAEQSQKNSECSGATPLSQA